MKISDLIVKLCDIKDVEGDLDVTVWADHGQLNQIAWSVGTQLRDQDGEVYHEDDVQYTEETIATLGLVRVLEIAG